MKAYWGSGRMLWSRHQKELGGELHAPAALSPTKEALVPSG
jgi:hypothetical protein